MAYVKNYRQSPNYSRGRPAGSANMIVIHYWDRPEKKPGFAGVVNWLCRSNGTSSAHYVVEDGRVTQLVSEDDRAWHAGNLGNPRGIGIECNPRMSAGDLETIAELIADIRKRRGNLPLRVHKEFMNTSCPGAYVGKLGWLSNRANQIRGAGGGSSGPSPTPSGTLAVDGYWGPATTRALQQINKTPVDGVVSSQPAAHKGILGGVSGWEFVSNPKGSLLVKAMQRAFKVEADGLFGPASIRAMQAYYKTPVDGVISPGGSSVVMAMQRTINNQLGGK